MTQILQTLWFLTLIATYFETIYLKNVKQCTEAPSNIQHAGVKARVYVRAKTTRMKAYKCLAYAKKEREICFQGSVKYRRIDRNVWNHNTMPLPVTLDPLVCKKKLDI